MFLSFINETATTDIYTLSLHDALPISGRDVAQEVGKDAHPHHAQQPQSFVCMPDSPHGHWSHESWHRQRLRRRSEEHTSELQSRLHLVCRLLLEKKK